MTSLAIAGIGVCATGMANWAKAQGILESPAPPVLDPLSRLAPDCLPPVERRRANATTRLAVTAAMQAIQDMPPEGVARLATVFSSADGDGEVLANMLTALAQPQVVLSPTLFHNSVFNAPAGYWSIGSHARAASITVSAGAASFAAGLEEARWQVLATGAAVLYIAYDAPFPAALASFAKSAEPFACALRLVPVVESRTGGYGRIEALGPDPGRVDQDLRSPMHLREQFSGNAAAEALPLLWAIANGCRAVVALPYLDGTRLWFDYLP